MLQIPAILKTEGSLVDGGRRLNFHTNELTRDATMAMLDMVGQFGWLCFSANEIQPSDIPKGLAPEDGFKSPSQRLRGALFVLYEQLPEDTRPADFEVYYRQQMERFIEAVKSRLT